MKLLAFDTSTELLSIALLPGAGRAVLTHDGAGGAQASAALIPAIEGLLARAGLQLAQLDAIAFGRGPGSFTGLRTAAAVAQGLGFGSGVPVLALDTLLAVAEDAHARSGATQVLAVLDARMGEVYAAAYRRRADGQWDTEQPPQLGKPEAIALPPGWTVAGNALALFGDRLPAGAVAALPTAAALLRLAPAAVALHPGADAAQALPLYIRDKVAQTTEERAAERARKEMNRGPAAGQPP
ncbi:tRNA (adenosine(37)-N6)-threonylcarbamoyltransferase complex dimerization subunit type 1 TsaB [Ramlibacter sp. XY19]|uniref:tRNA (adenosine(37)-N6)-threonylcarbamoyltransferase complex dimerization subunit type 1 TsaB n=1 Tax=Ramlibacter paludis TaxID=2908000 RepID=UPI0023DA5C62|nr:tRNA (adenosine(37)-N6)-threonylcarbamoyltransferase complex dimerization subunit type 1 TsaB [Ramlibacter paludis]